MDVSVAREPRRRTVRLADGEMSLLDFGDPARPVDAVFVHANGFNAQTYRAVLQPLAAGLRIWAPDLRGHGESRLPADPDRLVSWETYAADLRVLLAGVEGPPPVLAGHSMGATSGLLAAAGAPGRVRSLVLFEPVVLSRGRSLAARTPWARSRLLAHMPLARSALSRRRGFADRTAALDAYRGRGAFRSWPDASLADYVAGGFREAEEGGVRLACAPEWEAAGYAAQGADPRRALRRVQAPIRILKAERGSTCALTRGRPGLRLDVLAGAGHFLPLEEPELVRDALLDAVGP